MKVVISGGHLTPALAVIDYIQSYHPEITVEFVGRLYAQQKTKQLAYEKQEIEKRNLVFHSFSAQRSNTNVVISTFVTPLSLFSSFIKAIILLLQIKPDVFLSFGSYLSVPLGYACWVLRIPIVIHEQTRTVGRATKTLTPLAHRIAVSFPHLKKSFPKNKTVVTGNPIRKTLLNKSTKKPTWFTKKSKKPILYITGGSQGSEIINTTVSGALKKLLKKFTVIHQCGAKTSKRNYKNELEAVKKQLPLTLQKEYFIKERLSDQDLAWVLSHTACSVARSGANTVAELQRKKVPTLFIPLPFSINNEQLVNAQALKRKKAADILEQKKLNPKSLQTNIEKLYKNRKTTKAFLEDIPFIENSEKKIVSLLINSTS